MVLNNNIIIQRRKEMNSITELINKLKEMNEVGSICFSDYKELMVLARMAQTEGSN